MNHFVFVVCGSKEHTDKLNFSLKFLRHFSKADIVVVTDTSRNENKIEHDRIIDIKTPEKFTHHQASIFLKTGLIGYLPDMQEDKFCYLDSDVVAVSSDVDDIFHYTPSPVLFARDHCPFREFSPHAMQCSCLNETLKKNLSFYDTVNRCFPVDLFSSNRNSGTEKEKLDIIFSNLKKWHPSSAAKAIVYLTQRYILPLKQFKLADFTFNKRDKCWYNCNGDIIHFDYPYYASMLKKQSGIIYNKNTGKWEDADGNNITPETPHCNHLSEYIRKKYNVTIPDSWRHWNGGVFLFDRHAKSFLNYWHKISLQEFQNKNTLTRDQFTLAISAWKFGLQNLKTLPVKFNFITEYSTPDIKWSKNIGYTYNDFKSVLHPAFLHIYHNWGDEKWDIWQSVIKKREELGRLKK
jgi:hypothetical protein